MSRIGRIARNRLSDSVYDRLQAAIYEGVLLPGDRLRETELAARFGTSQATVREALHRLEQNWIVESEPHRGTYVRRLLRQDMEDLLKIRSAYDEVVIRRAVPLMSQTKIDELEGLLQRMEQCVNSHDIVSLTRADMDFHGLVWAATGCSLLCSMSSSVYGTFMLGVTTVARRSWSYTLGTAERHIPITRAFRRRDADAAVQANWEHMQRSIEYMALSDELAGQDDDQAAVGSDADGAQGEDATGS